MADLDDSNPAGHPSGSSAEDDLDALMNDLQVSCVIWFLPHYQGDAQPEPEDDDLDGFESMSEEDDLANLLDELDGPKKFFRPIPDDFREQVCASHYR